MSEAIREGAKLRPQARGWTIKDGKTCATGAALEAIEGTVNESDLGYVERLFSLYPYTRTKADCPEACGHYDGDSTVLSMIAHLNDVHRWTREAIADWLEEIERAAGYVLLEMPETQPASALSGDISVTSEEFCSALS